MGNKGLTVGQILSNKQRLPEIDPREDAFPGIPQDLLDHLDRLYPMSQPDIGDTEREIWYRYGQTSVVQLLKHRKEGELDHVRDPHR